MRPKQLTMDLADADPNGVFEDQQLGAAGDFTLNGAGVSGGEWASPDGFAHQISFESTGNLSGVTFTITGYADAAKHIPLTEAVTGPNNATVESSGYFAVITQIAASAAVGTNVEAGHVDEAVTNAIPLNTYSDTTLISADVTGTVDYTIQVTMDDPQVVANHPLTWQDIDDSALVDVTASAYSIASAGLRAIRVQINSYSSGAEVKLSYSQAAV